MPQDSVSAAVHMSLNNESIDNCHARPAVVEPLQQKESRNNS